MAGATGLEPATSGVTGRRSNQLSYAPSASTGEAPLSSPPQSVKPTAPAQMAGSSGGQAVQAGVLGERYYRDAPASTEKRLSMPQNQLQPGNVTHDRADPENWRVAFEIDSVEALIRGVRRIWVYSDQGTHFSAWWAMRDSNPRPPRCKRGALPTELIALPPCARIVPTMPGSPCGSGAGALPEIDAGQSLGVNSWRSIPGGQCPGVNPPGVNSGSRATLCRA
jgi:hypothetical protein